MGQLEGQVAFVTGAARGLGESVMLGFMHALNRELREQGIRVTALSSGGMRTPFITERFPDVDVGTLQDPQLLADALLFVVPLPATSHVPELVISPMRDGSFS